MKLTVLERITLLAVLPSEGSLVTLKVVRKLREDLSFNEKEIAELKFVETAGQIKWEAGVEPPDGTEIGIGEKATDLIVERLKTLDREQKLKDNHLSLCEKFGVA